MSKQEYQVTVTTVPHPNPERALDLLAQMILKELLKEQETRQSATSA